MGTIYNKKMKRLHSQINKLTIYKPKFLKCEVCGKRIYNYEKCISPYVYCSYDCLSILVLADKNSYMDEDNIKFE